MSPWGMIKIPKKTHADSDVSFYSENIPPNQCEGKLGDIHAHILHPRNMHDNEQSGTGKKILSASYRLLSFSFASDPSSAVQGH